MRVEQERRHAQGEDRHPEVRNPTRPDGECDIEQHDERPHAEVDAWACETGVQDREGDARRCETTTRRDVPRPTKGQVRDDRVRGDLRGKDFERGREGGEVLRETKNCLARTTLNEFYRRRR